MARLTDKVKAILARRFPGAAIELKPLRPGNRIVGSLVWKGFRDLEQIDRQIALRDAVESGLSQEDTAKVSFILTLTPLEDASLSEEEGANGHQKRRRVSARH